MTPTAPTRMSISNMTMLGTYMAELAAPDAICEARKLSVTKYHGEERYLARSRRHRLLGTDSYKHFRRELRRMEAYGAVGGGVRLAIAWPSLAGTIVGMKDCRYSLRRPRDVVSLTFEGDMVSLPVLSRSTRRRGR